MAHGRAQTVVFSVFIFNLVMANKIPAEDSPLDMINAEFRWSE